MTTDQAREQTRFLRGLRAVRDYTPDAISDEVINDILSVGRWAGSAGNWQPTEVVVVRDAAIKNLMGDNGARPSSGASAVLVIVSPGNEERRDIESFDVGRLVERLLLAAHAHGLGANIATLKAEGPELVRKALGIPEGRRVWTVVTLGYKDEAAHAARPRNANPGRKARDTFTHWEKY